MAAGSSAPELFTSVIGVFITKGDVGVGTIVGSAVFNILCIIGVCGIFAGQAVKLSHWTLLRDSAYYTLSIAALIAFIYDGEVTWWESLVLNVMYLFYILIMKFNGRARRYFDRRKKSSVSLANGLTGSTDLEDNVTCDATAVLLKKANFQCKPSVLMVDELLSAYPHQLSFSEAGMRIMITSHFSPRTRLTMASRMLINEVRLSRISQTRISLTSFKHQLSEQLTDYCTCTEPIYNLAQTTTPFPTVFIYFPPLHPIISISTLHILPLQINHSSVLLAILYLLRHHGLYFAFTSLISPHLLTLYIDLCFYCIIDSMCNSVLLYVSNCFALSWPGRYCK
uniref:Sodium/calcium exchanger membrane region domain-containing protein n=1 Tax=Oncorhynchus kisutch TaxID=8019 RepID=A0A8C7HF78_ONCKI